MAGTLLRPDWRKDVDGLARRVGILERRVTVPRQTRTTTTSDGGTHEGAGSNSTILRADLTNPPEANAVDSLAIGDGALVDGDRGIGIGKDCWVLAVADDGVAIGQGSVARNLRASALGYSADASGADSVAIGNSVAGSNGITIGNSASNVGTSDYSIAIGIGAATSAANGIAIGRSSHAQATHGVAIGYDADAGDGSTKTEAVGVGYLARAWGQYSIAVGSNALANAQYATAIGRGTTITDTQGTVLGASAFATATGATALGYGAGAGNARATAVGTGAQTTATDQVNTGKHWLAAAALTSAPADSTLVGGTNGAGVSVGQFTFWLDEAANALRVKVKYSDNTTVKSAAIPLT